VPGDKPWFGVSVEVKLRPAVLQYCKLQRDSSGGFSGYASQQTGVLFKRQLSVIVRYNCRIILNVYEAALIHRIDDGGASQRERIPV